MEIKINKKFFLGLPLVFISLQVYFGALFGYFLGRLCAGKETGLQGKIKSLAFDIGKYRIHLHHWLFSLLILIFTFNFLSLPLFSSGFFGGLVFHGISSYQDWHKVLIKK